MKFIQNKVRMFLQTAMIVHNLCQLTQCLKLRGLQWQQTLTINCLMEYHINYLLSCYMMIDSATHTHTPTPWSWMFNMMLTPHLFLIFHSWANLFQLCLTRTVDSHACKTKVLFTANQKASSEERKASSTKQSFFFLYKEVKQDTKVFYNRKVSGTSPRSIGASFRCLLKLHL